VRRRLALVPALLIAMSGFGLGVYHALGSFKTDVTRPPDEPTKAKPAFTLPGTIYLAQGGAIYRLRGETFTAITDKSGWMQPALTADGRLLAIKRSDNFSDLYLLDGNGKVVQQLTHDEGTDQKGINIDSNHWVFYPRVGTDGTTVFFAFDAPKQRNGQQYEVALSVWSQALSDPTPTARTGKSPNARQWTESNQFTGGDVEPVPLAGGLLYVGYGFDNKEQLNATLLYQAGPLQQAKPLTSSDDDCSKPTLSPDLHTLAYVCTAGKQTAELRVATFDGTTLSAPRTLISGQLVTAPTWAPDGSGLAYLSPASTGGAFQLWWLAGAGGPTPATPKQVTTNLGFDATSPPAWSAAG
jgi:Tol biopolymer transport system component